MYCYESVNFWNMGIIYEVFSCLVKDIDPACGD